MSNEIVHQALYGYASGHRLLAASRSLPPESARLLRAATDTGIECHDSQYLTVLPLADVRAQAFIRTWQAEPWLRPGTVWSHVLFVDFVVLANAARVSGITSLFRRPQLEPGRTEPDLSPYMQPVAADLGSLRTAGAVDHDLARQVLSAVYGAHGGRVVLAVQDVGAAEATLLAVHDQQWPRLRRHFAFRTRLRPSDGSTPYDLEVVERGRAAGIGEGEPQAWVQPLIDDLATGEGTDLRRFLRTFGSGSTNGRRDMPQLVLLYQRLVNATPVEGVAALCEAFSEPDQMNGLKRALLGVPTRSGWVPPDWPEQDAVRLALLFDAPPHAVDYDELEVPRRLASVIRADASAAAAALHRLDLERLPPPQVAAIVAAVVGGSDDEAAAAIAVEQPDLGVLIAARRPVLLGRPEVWAGSDPDLLVDVYGRARVDQQRAALRSLLDLRAEGPLISLCSAAPALWWDLLTEAAQPGVNVARLAADGTVLRRVLDRVGAAAIGAPHYAPQTPEHLLALLLSADASTGVWRHAPADAWIALWRDIGDRRSSLPPDLRDRLATVSLLAAASSGSRPLRIAAWQVTFPHLHSALAHAAFDEEAWRSLSGALPAAPEWDRCLRLRRGAVGEIRRDRWSADETVALLNATGGYRQEMLDELQQTPARKKGKHWLRQLVEALLP